jgi:hypothetical protein
LVKEEMDISGEWIGIITYGKQYEQFAGEKLWFELNLEQTGNKFSGIALDIRGFGINEFPARISGLVNHGDIEFDKVYDNEQLLEDLWESRYTGEASVPIQYFGSFNEVSQEFIGTWIITEKFKILKIIPWNIESKGTWSMKRKVSNLSTQNLTTLKT